MLNSSFLFIPIVTRSYLRDSSWPYINIRKFLNLTDVNVWFR
jgi:hypothetical protein